MLQICYLILSLQPRLSSLLNATRVQSGLHHNFIHSQSFHGTSQLSTRPSSPVAAASNHSCDFPLLLLCCLLFPIYKRSAAASKVFFCARMVCPRSHAHCSTVSPPPSPPSLTCFGFSLSPRISHLLPCPMCPLPVLPQLAQNMSAWLRTSRPLCSCGSHLCPPSAACVSNFWCTSACLLCPHSLGCAKSIYVGVPQYAGAGSRA